LDFHLTVSWLHLFGLKDEVGQTAADSPFQPPSAHVARMQGQIWEKAVWLFDW
jgi:hypothetical protein